MNFLRNLLPALLVALAVSSSAFATCPGPVTRPTTINRDFEAVQEYVNSKRTIPLEEKDCNLTIAGDIRFAWDHITEKVNGVRLRGHVPNAAARQNPVTGVITDVGGPGIPFSTSEFDVELNLYFDYKCDRAWGVAWIQYDNAAGIGYNGRPCSIDPQGLKGSGCCDGLCLRKAYMGYNIYADGCSRFDVEIGRRPMYTLFDSRIQFQSRFDGVVLKYYQNLDCWGDFYVYLGGFVVDERVSHFAYITEAGFLNIYECGIDFRYSFIDWQSALSKDRNRCQFHNPRGAEFKISQFMLSYRFNPEFICMPAKLYGAFLWNHAARDLVPSGLTGTGSPSKANLGFYVGAIIGEVCGEGDWAFDFNYQYVEAQAIPGRDCSGIGRGGNNLLNDSLYQVSGVQRDYTNYKGWWFSGLYALTDNLTLDATLEFSKEIQKKYGGPHNYSKFQLEAIFAF